MDQNSSNGTDKRSWRERLGIGAGKDMPRIADEFAPPAAAPAAARPAAVKPAPMAPRPGVKAAPPRGTAAAAPPPASGEKLAEKLKAQREAQERLAEQRVQAARQRAEVKLPEANGSKPKFTFAVDDAEQKTAAAPAATPPAKPQFTPPPAAAAKPVASGRTVAPPPPPMTPPPITPPRAALGAERPVMPPRAPAQMPPPVVPTRPQSRFAPPPAGGFGSPPGYGAQVPPYRPIDPGARGYAGAGYQPPPAYTPPPPVGNYGGQPRLNMPAANPPQAGYGAEGYETRARSMRPPPRPAVGGYRDDYQDGDVFAETRATRRATAGDYSQAYRDEQGYDEELPPSRGPWLPLALLLLLGILAGGAIWWFYQSSINPNTAGGQSGNTPVVEAPSQPAKLTPDPVPAQQNQPAKKLIYDRIVGDREVLGGDVIQSEEVPAPPGDSTNMQQGIDPAAATGEPAPAQPAGQEELVPLPLPPPPGEGGAGDQQGALPGDKSSNQAMIEPAAGASQAAEPSLTGTTKSDQEGIISVSKSDPASGNVPAAAEAPAKVAETAPVPGEMADSGSMPADAETISDPDPVPEPAKKKPAAEKAKKPAAKKATKAAEKKLGSKPVVLVPPSGEAAAAEQDVASIETGNVAAGGAGSGLYDGDAISDAPAGAAATPAPAPVKKKRTIADLFRGDEAADEAPSAPVQQQAAAPAKQVQSAPAPKAVQPPAQQQASTGGDGYVVQLASFTNQGDANKEYGRLKAKHGAALSGLSPIVTQAVVGGSTRYRLAVGVMDSREQASAVCSKLFAGGERDCLVRRQ